MTTARALSDRETIAAHENTALFDPIICEAAFTVVPATNVYTLIVRKTLPDGMLGILRGLAVQTPNQADLINLFWQLRVNGNPVIGLDDVNGPQATIQFPRPVLIELYKNSIIEIWARNVSGVAIADVTGALYGNYFPAHSGGGA